MSAARHVTATQQAHSDARTLAQKSEHVAPELTATAQSVLQLQRFVGNQETARVVSIFTGGSFWEHLRDLFSGPPKNDAPATPSASSQAAPRTSTPKQATGPAYESQRDNTYKKNGVSGDNMCNVTTLSMQLETLAGSQLKARQAAAALLIKNGASESVEALQKQQLEDLIMRRFDQIGASGWKDREGDGLIPKGFANSVTKSGIPFHQWAVALASVAREFSSLVGDTRFDLDGKNKDLLSKDYIQKTLKPAQEKGAAIMLSTLLTGGHIVLLAQVLDDGILINDPYGMLVNKRGDYVRNGSATKPATKRFTKDAAKIEHRLSHNQDLWTKLQDKEKLEASLPQNLGERNFYDWDEVKAYSIGKWNNVLLAAKH